MRVTASSGIDGHRAGSLSLTAIILLVLCIGAASAQDDPFPRIRPATRAQAEAAITGGADLPVPCMTPLLHSLALDPLAGPPAALRAARMLQSRTFLPAEMHSLTMGNVEILYGAGDSSFDQIEADDRNGNGTPDVVEGARRGLIRARNLLVQELELTPPTSLTAVLTRIESDIHGYLVPAANGSSQGPLAVIDAGPGRRRYDVAREMIHQYAHAVVMELGPGLPPEWAEAFAVWSVLKLTGASYAGLIDHLDSRLERSAEGLLSGDLELAAGNALWFAFLDEAYGPLAVRLTLQELSLGAPPSAALHRAMNRSAGVSLSDALSEFHTWGILTGERSHGMHFPFAASLQSPRFATAADYLPVLSVQANPSIAPLGSAQILLRPGRSGDGLTVRFEGEFPVRWEADLLLFRTDRTLYRLPIVLDAEGRGELTVPNQSLEEAVLMIRNLDAEDGVSGRYTWTAHREQGFPYELESLDAAGIAGGQSGVLVTWETETEQHLIGFNILRSAVPGAAGEKINPIWMPAIGDRSTPASYQFLDSTARPGMTYHYRIEGITMEGLGSRSEAISVTLRTPPAAEAE